MERQELSLLGLTISGLRTELNKIGATLTADKIVITDADGKLGILLWPW